MRTLHASMSLSIKAVLVNFNGYQDTIDCLSSLQKQIGVACQPLVIDNGSQNNSVSLIQAAHPNVEIIKTGRNLGFAGGSNVGIRHALEAGADYLFLVNNDTTLEPDCLQLLIDCALSRSDAAVVVPAIYREGDKSKPWFTGSTASIENGVFLHEERDLRAEGIVAPFDIPWATGCAMLVSASRLREIGDFDTRFFCYYEDVDWSLRAAQAGGVCVLCPQAVLYHKVFGSSATTSKKIYYYDARNQLLCLAKNSAADRRQGAVRRRTAATLEKVRYMLTPAGAAEGERRALAAFLGVMDYHLRRFGPCRYSRL